MTRRKSPSGDALSPDDVPHPMLVVPVSHGRWALWAQAQKLRHRQTGALHGNAAPIMVPQYAKILIGGLAAHAHGGATRLTCDCPGTLWTT